MKTHQKIKLAEAEANRRKKLVPPTAEEIGVVIDEKLKQYHDDIQEYLTALQPLLEKATEKPNYDELVGLNNSLVKALAAIESGITVENQLELKDLVISNLKDIIIPDVVSLKDPINLKGLATNEDLKVGLKKSAEQLTRLASVVHEFVKAESKKQPQTPENFIPYRRVILKNNKLVFDDTPTGSGAGGGGGGFPAFMNQAGLPAMAQLDSQNQVIISGGGGGGGSSEVINENPTGTKNGINLIFTTFYQFKPATTKLYLNGQRLAEGVGNDYVEQVDHQTIVFTSPPINTDVLIIDYYRL